MTARQMIKDIFFYTVLVIYFPLHIPYLLFCSVSKNEIMFREYSAALSVLPGIIGSKLRTVFYWLTLDECSKDITIEMGSYFVSRKCRIGKNVYIGTRCIISFADIGKDTLIGSHVNVLSGKRQHHIERLDIPIRLQGGQREKIQIGENCWMGNGAVVMADVAEGSVVAAGSVVISPVERFSIVGGNPAKVIKKRI
jgi:virginiamycin A acetyltransferase